MARSIRFKSHKFGSSEISIEDARRLMDLINALQLPGVTAVDIADSQNLSDDELLERDKSPTEPLVLSIVFERGERKSAAQLAQVFKSYPGAIQNAIRQLIELLNPPNFSPVQWELQLPGVLEAITRGIEIRIGEI